jgi:hypothetical protein
MGHVVSMGERSNILVKNSQGNQDINGRITEEMDL